MDVPVQFAVHNMADHAMILLAPKAIVEVPGVKVEVTESDTWETVGMIVVAVLAIYLGIKLINKYIK